MKRNIYLGFLLVSLVIALGTGSYISGKESRRSGGRSSGAHV